jgi:hypothetical protein
MTTFQSAASARLLANRDDRAWARSQFLGRDSGLQSLLQVALSLLDVAGGQASDDPLVGPVASLPQFVVVLLDVVGHHDRLADPGIFGHLAVDVLAAAGVLEGSLPEHVDEGPISFDDQFTTRW